MTDTILDASVIICAYTEKRWDDLVAAIESVQQQNAREIVVVVDHNPALLTRVQAYFPGVIGIENSEPQGLSGARNSGVAIAQGTLVAFLDDDAMAEPDWLARLCRCCEDPQVMGTGGTVEPYWLSKQPKWFPEEFYWTLGCTYQERPEKPIVVRNPFGGCTCYRRELFEAVGGFRTGIGRDRSARPMGGEETELCIRARPALAREDFSLRARCDYSSSYSSSPCHMALLSHPLLCRGSIKSGSRSVCRNKRWPGL